MKKECRESRKSQITIFVIIALLIVAIIALLLFRNHGVATISAKENPQNYMDKCIDDAATKILDGMTENTGIGDRAGVKVFRYNGTNIAYLCYTNEYNVLCNNEHPMLNKEIESEILKKLKPEVEKCLLSLKNELVKYEYSEDTVGQLVNVSIVPKKVVIGVNKKISYLKNEARYSIEGFRVEITSSLFDFISLSSKIIEQEMDCDCQIESCNADTLGLSLKNSGFEVSKPVYDFTKGKIYVIKDNLKGDIFQFAIKNCVREIPL